MKKRFSIITMTLIALFTLTTGVLAATAYNTWNGSDDYHEFLENIGLVKQKGQELKEERDGYHRENEQLVNVIKDKDNAINSLEQEIEALEKRINDGQTTQDQLRQAEIDMKDVNNKTKEVLNSLN